MSTPVLVPSCGTGTAAIAAAIWREVKDGNLIARALFGRHYTYNQHRNQIDMWNAARNRNWSLFVGPGQKLVLLTADDSALFVWRKFISMDRQEGVNCAIFRNEGAALSSLLISAADEIAWQRWPGQRLYTYVDRDKTRPKRDAGFCFICAGWQPCGKTKGGLVILEKLADSTSAADAVRPSTEQ